MILWKIELVIEMIVIGARCAVTRAGCAEKVKTAWAWAWV
jgi:hypothetical protein